MIQLLKNIIFKYSRKSLSELKGEIIEEYDPIVKGLKRNTFTETEKDFIKGTVQNGEKADPFKTISDYIDLSFKERGVDIRNLRVNILYLNRYHICFYSYKETVSLFDFIEDFEYKIQAEIQDRLKALFLHGLEQKINETYIVNSYPYGGIPDA